MFDVKVVETRLSELHVQPGFRTVGFSCQVGLAVSLDVATPLDKDWV